MQAKSDDMPDSMPSGPSSRDGVIEIPWVTMENYLKNFI